MKKSYKFISVFLALIMVAALLPTLAFAEEAETAQNSSTSGSVIDTVSGIELPTYAVYCKLSSGLPASNAVITMTEQLTGETKVYTANMLGLALIPKSLLGVYTVAATYVDPTSGAKYSTLPGIKWTMSVKPALDTLVLYPVLNVGLNYTDHFSYMVGYNDGTVKPNNNITRAEACSLIFRLLTDEARTQYMSTSCPFTDVSSGSAHKNAIATLYNAGVINGYTSSTFGPNDTITREQFSAIIGRFFSVEFVGSPMFGDLAGGYADKYINLLAQLGIINGYGDGTVGPKDLITRAQAVSMLNRLLGRLPSSTSAASCAGVKTWPDCPSSMWCYGDILEATNSHNYTWAMNLGGIVSGDTAIQEAWTSLRTDTPDWTALQK